MSEGTLGDEVARLRRKLVFTMGFSGILAVAVVTLLVGAMRSGKSLRVDELHANYIKTNGIVIEPGELDEVFLRELDKVFPYSASDGRYPFMPSAREQAKRQRVGLEMLLSANGLHVTDKTSSRDLHVVLDRERPVFAVYATDENGEVLVPVWERYMDRAENKGRWKK